MTLLQTLLVLIGGLLGLMICIGHLLQYRSRQRGLKRHANKSDR